VGDDGDVVGAVGDAADGLLGERFRDLHAHGGVGVGLVGGDARGVEDALQVGEQVRPCGAEPGAVRVALEEHDAELGLERVDLLGDRRRREEDLAGGTADGSAAGDRVEAAQLLEAHRVEGNPFRGARRVGRSLSGRMPTECAEGNRRRGGSS
jgi:hypothetical protein